MRREPNASISTLFVAPPYPKAKPFNIKAGSPNLTPLRSMAMTFNIESSQQLPPQPQMAMTKQSSNSMSPFGATMKESKNRLANYAEMGETFTRDANINFEDE